MPAPDARAWWGFGLVPMLLRSRLRMATNAAWRSGRERRAWSVIVAVCVAGAMVSGFRLAVALMGDGAPSPGAAEGAVATAVGMLAGFTGVTAVTFALSALYFARDLEPLLVAPLPPRSILLTKLCVQLATGAGLGAVLATPVLIAYLDAEGALAALPFTGLVVVCMAAIPLAAGTAAAVMVVRVLPARRVRDAGGLLVTIVVAGVVALNLAVRGVDGLSVSAPGGLGSGGPGIANALWLPTGWASRALVAAWTGDVAAAAAWAAPLLIGGPLALVLVARLCERAFVTGYRRSQEASSGRSRRLRHGGARRATPPRPAWLAIAIKDLREVRRDSAQLAQLLIPIVLFAVYIVAPGGVPAGFGRTGRLPSWFGIALTAGFASLFAASGLALRGVGTEGRRMWMLRAAPLGPRAVLAAKCASGGVVAGGLGTALLWLGGLRSHVAAFALVPATVRLAVIVGGLTCMGVGLGAVRPRLDWTDPRRAVGVGTSFAFLGLGAAYLTAAFVIVALPYAGGAPTRLGLAVADSALGLLGAASAGFALSAGAARLRALEL